MSKLKKGSKILIANDSVGLTGVQTYISNVDRELTNLGYEVVRIEPTDPEFIKISSPTYKDFNWTLFATPIITKRILEERPDAILISTVETPIGSATRNVCEFLEISNICKSCDFTLSYTTDLGKYISKILENSVFGSISKDMKRLKKFEQKVVDFSEEQYIRGKYLGARRVMVNAPSSKKKLEDMGIKNIRISGRGINKEMYHLPTKEDINPYESLDWYKENPLPILLYLGRVAYEKDIQLFLEGDYPDYHRVVVGDGPAKDELAGKYGGKENVHFLGKKPRGDCPNYFMYAEVTFFPSSFDTFGNTIIESTACGTPVVGFNVQGPKDVIKPGVMGVIVPQDGNLFDGLSMALEIDMEECSRYTHENFSWEKAAKELVKNLYPIKWRK